MQRGPGSADRVVPHTATSREHTLTTQFEGMNTNGNLVKGLENLCCGRTQRVLCCMQLDGWRVSDSSWEPTAIGGEPKAL